MLFVLAATPLVELLVVIPLGIGYGLPPAAVALITWAGNAAPVVGIVVLFERWRAWRRRRAAGDAAEADAADGGGGRRGGGRWQRAQRLWARYGTPGLALLAPLVTGVHLAAVVALALGAPRRTVLGWMLLSLAAWTLALTLAVVAGVEGVRHLTS